MFQKIPKDIYISKLATCPSLVEIIDHCLCQDLPLLNIGSFLRKILTRIKVIIREAHNIPKCMWYILNWTDWSRYSHRANWSTIITIKQMMTWKVTWCQISVKIICSQWRLFKLQWSWSETGRNFDISTATLSWYIDICMIHWIIIWILLIQINNSTRKILIKSIKFCYIPPT